MTAALPAIADGIVRQKNYKKEVPPPVKYALTRFGHAQQGLERRLELS
jgi:DNA-binding HxlR family transcriptional regulator